MPVSSLAHADGPGQGRAIMSTSNPVSALSVWLALESPPITPRRQRHDGSRRRRVEGLPIAVERVPGRDGLGDSLVLRAGRATGQPAIAVMSHLDTVHPVGTAARDLPVRVEGDRLYGPASTT